MCGDLRKRPFLEHTHPEHGLVRLLERVHPFPDPGRHVLILRMALHIRRRVGECRKAVGRERALAALHLPEELMLGDLADPRGKPAFAPVAPDRAHRPEKCLLRDLLRQVRISAEPEQVAIDDRVMGQVQFLKILHCSTSFYY